MQYSKIASLVLAAAASLVRANNVVTFKSLDDVDRTVYFTPNDGLQWIQPISIAAGESKDVSFPAGWIGNFYGVHNGKVAAPGMLGEVAFNGWNGQNYFDVSAIIDATDVDNVSEMFPYNDPQTPISGCGHGFPCNTAYYHADDVQTRVTTQTHLVCTLSKNGYSPSKRDIEEDAFEAVSRDHVLGKL